LHGRPARIPVVIPNPVAPFANGGEGPAFAFALAFAFAFAFVFAFAFAFACALAFRCHPEPGRAFRERG